MARCHAIRLGLRNLRCSKSAGDRWFCHEHHSWLLGRAAAVLGTLLVALVGNFIWQSVAPRSKVEDDVAKIRTMLEANQRGQSAGVGAYVRSAGLEEKYPLGFALFYSDGRRTLHYGRPVTGLAFDPAGVRVSKFTQDEVCLDFVLGDAIFNDNCFMRRGGEVLVFAPFQVGQADVLIERLADSAEGFAWVVGLHPAADSMMTRDPRR